MPQLANFQCSFPTTPAPSNSITKSMSSVSLSFCCLGDFRGFQCHASGSYRFIVVKCSHYGLKSRLLCHRPKSTCSLGTKFLNNERRGWHGRIHLEYYICDYDYAVVLSLTYSVNCTSQILEYYLLDSSAQLLECRLRNLKRLIDLSRIQSDKPICLPPVPVVFSTIMTFECLTGPGGCSDIETLSLRRAESLANRRPNCPRTRLPLFVVVTSRYSSAWRDFISFVLYLCGRSRVRVVRQEFHDYTTGMRYKTQRSCSGMQLVHVAGTFEVGLGLVGTPLSKAMETAVPGTTTKSITYDTSAEYVATVAAGSAIMKNYLQTQSASCPDQKYILSGYSKGALVLHGMNLDADLKSKITNILVFGDPMRNIQTSQWPINSPSVDLAPRDGSDNSQNVASFCNAGDLFCFVPGTSLPAHLAYGTDGSIGVAANFVKPKA